MVALTGIAMALGAAASVAGVVSANKAKNDAKATTKANELKAKNAAALETPDLKQDPNFILGTEDPKSQRRTSASTKKASTAKPSSPIATGGISASSVGGL